VTNKYYLTQRHIYILYAAFDTNGRPGVRDT